ncbi:uncharacterized protein LOC126298071 [Schistocerca gregaria]|uniref:uncharacterized protein LOC126298071 n=1 Tax=Schistocerca gregaria TaxID=7010 RepID=UPI00211F3158|nr:uncharacterized protein LOC126298071 [Schistocerca gregaria]
MSGKDWAYDLLQRRNLSLRVPLKTSRGRVMGFNKQQLSIFFDNLSSLMERYKFEPHCIHKMDESGITTVPKKVLKVIATCGKKDIGKIASAVIDQPITVVCCMGAGGSYIHPGIKFSWKRMKESLKNGAPPGSLMMCSDTGYINSDLHLTWSRLSLNAVLYCRDHNIHVLTIPPHHSHKMQALDRYLCKPLKDFHSQESISGSLTTLDM